jgi:hypothetical protein
VRMRRKKSTLAHVTARRNVKSQMIYRDLETRVEFDVRFIWKTASRRAAYESHRISPIAYRMAAVRTQCAR